METWLLFIAAIAALPLLAIEFSFLVIVCSLPWIPVIALTWVAARRIPRVGVGSFLLAAPVAAAFAPLATDHGLFPAYVILYTDPTNWKAATSLGTMWILLGCCGVFARQASPVDNRTVKPFYQLPPVLGAFVAGTAGVSPLTMSPGSISEPFMHISFGLVWLLSSAAVYRLSRSKI